MGNGQSAATFSIGPLSTVIEAAALERWCAAARAGEVKLYATGPCLPRGSATVMLAREYAGAGLIHLKARRVAGHGWEYLAERASAPLPRPVASVPRRIDANSPMARLRGAVTRAADFARPLPSNAQLATLCELKDANAVKYRLRQIMAEGGFRLIDNGPNRARNVERVGK